MDFQSWYGSAMVNPSNICGNYSNPETDYDSCAYPYPNQPLQIADRTSPANLNFQGANEMAQRVTSHPLDEERTCFEEKIGGESWPSMISGPHEMSRSINNFSGSSATIGSVLVHQVSSMESMDGLLSSPESSNTEKSVEEEDEIAMVLSDCRSFLNFHEAASSSIYPNHKIIQSKRRSNQTELQPDENHRWNKKKPRSENSSISSSNINFQQPSLIASMWEPDSEAIEQMKEMIYREAAFRPVNLGLEVVQKPKRKNVRISTDPQTVAARQRRERISERIRVLQKLVPGGSKMDTASMLDEAANYLKFLRSQVKALENLGHTVESTDCSPTGFAFSFNPNSTSFPSANPNQIHHFQT